MTETNGLEDATSTTNTVAINSRTSTCEPKKSAKLICGQDVVRTSHTRRIVNAIALTRNDFTPTRTAGNASTNETALKMGADANTGMLASVTSAATRRAGIQSSKYIRQALRIGKRPGAVGIIL